METPTNTHGGAEEEDLAIGGIQLTVRLQVGTPPTLQVVGTATLNLGRNLWSFVASADRSQTKQGPWQLSLDAQNNLTSTMNPPMQIPVGTPGGNRGVYRGAAGVWKPSNQQGPGLNQWDGQMFRTGPGFPNDEPVQMEASGGSGAETLAMSAVTSS